MEYIKKNATLIVAGILLFHLVVSLLVSSQESMIYDEKAHIPASYSYVRYGDMRLNPEHPPLLKDLAGLPLLFLDVKFPLEIDEWQNGTNEQWVVGDVFINCSRPDVACNNADAILFWSRIPITIIALLLGVALFVWTKEIAGTLAGVFAVTLYAFDPNIIAHNHYVTTDLGIAAFIFFAFYFFTRFLKSPTWKNVVVAGIFLGLAEITKFSAVLLFPIFGLFALVYAITKQKNSSDKRSALSFKLCTLLSYTWKYTLSVLVCFVLIWGTYAVNTMNMPDEKFVALVDRHLSQPNPLAQTANDFVMTLHSNTLLQPWSEYFLGVFMVFGRVAGGNVHYFLGTVSDISSSWYFPVVFLLKETLPFLFLLVLTALYGIYRLTKSLFQENTDGLLRLFARSFQNRTAEYFAFFFIVFYSFISITGNLNIGFRHLFPILPFIYMLLAKAVFDIYKRLLHEPVTRKMFLTLLGGLTFAIVAIPVLAYPSYLSYFNATSGGHVSGYKYVTDSNYDWGQDLKHLKNFVEMHNACTLGTTPFRTDCSETLGYPPIDKIRVDYFGGGNPGYYLKEKYIPWWASHEKEPGWYAISSFFYQEDIYKNKQPGQKGYEWLKDIAPLTRAGDSFFIYYIDK